MTAPRLRTVLRRTVVALTLVAALLVLVTAGLFLVTTRAGDRADRSRDTLLALQQLRGDVFAAEASLRGFALTRRPSFLVPYRENVPRVTAGVALLTGRVRDEDRAAIGEIGRRFDRWRRTFAEPVLADLEAGRTAAARRTILSGRGKAQIDPIRARIRVLSEAERADRDAEQRRADRLAAAGVGGVGALALAAFVLGVALQRRVRRDVVEPVEHLAEATSRFGDGELRMHAEVTGVQEIRTTAIAFNAMARRIEATVSELRELDELKSRFVSTVSHELRTPLTAIRGFTEELAEDADDLRPDQREAVEIIARNAGHLEAIIDDLLLLSSLEAGRIRLEPAAVDVAALLAELRRELGPAAQARGVTLELDTSGDLTVRADRARLRQACANLLSNAVKFSPPDEVVTLAAHQDDGTVAIEVRDRGPGIPAEEHERLTERFFRASTAGGVPGTGLGLTIASELVQRHGGHLEVDSAPGEGAAFRILLPRDGAGAQAAGEPGA